MKQKHIGQARGADAGLAGATFLLDGWNGSENTTPIIDRQAAMLAARFGLPPSRARLIARFAFGEARR